MSIQKLPIELLRKIFNNIHDLEQLAQARLVCILWGEIAEEVMLKKPITIHSEYTAQKLIKLLETNPDKGNMIRSLDIGNNWENYPPSEEDLPRLLDLTFTPNIVELHGMCTSKIFKELIRIKHESNKEFDHLKIMLKPFHETDMVDYYSAALEFKKTLQEVYIIAYYTLDQGSPEFCQFTSKLDQFTCLTTLEIVGIKMLETPKLDNILSKCSRLVTLNIQIVGSGMNHQESTGQINQAVENGTIPICSNVKELNFEVSAGGSAERAFVFFLLQKFPNLEKLSVEMSFEKYTMDAQDHTIFRLYNAVKKIRAYLLTLKFPTHEAQCDYLLAQLETGIHIKTHYSYMGGQFHITLKKNLTEDLKDYS